MGIWESTERDDGGCTVTVPIEAVGKARSCWELLVASAEDQKRWVCKGGIKGELRNEW